MHGGACSQPTVGQFSCTCAAGYTGDRCQTDIDDCAPTPCSNGGSCVDGVDSFTCTCALPFTGAQCQTQLDACVAQSPCHSSGTCQPIGLDDFACKCPIGFTGRTCQTEVNECESTLCRNGTCEDRLASFVCHCSAGWTGLLCESDIDECDSSPCASHSSCMDMINGYLCSCAAGFTGTDCQRDVNECSLQPCQHGGTCINGQNSFSCRCAAGYTGSECQTDVDDCATLPCQNNATCTDGVDSVTCTCSHGFTGPLCETNIDDCANAPCGEAGTCVDGVSSFTCLCPSGFEGDFCQNATSAERKVARCNAAGYDLLEAASLTRHMASFNGMPSSALGTSFTPTISLPALFTSWVWLEQRANGTIFTFAQPSGTSFSIAIRSGRVTVSDALSAATFSALLLTEQSWHHLAVLITASMAEVTVDGTSLGSNPLAVSIRNEATTIQLGAQLSGMLRYPTLSGSVSGNLVSLSSCLLSCSAFSTQSCSNGGRCVDFLNGEEVCRCPVSWTGTTCQRSQTQLSFAASGFATVQPTPASSNISFRVRLATPTTTGHQLLADLTTQHKDVGRVQVLVVDGRVQASVWDACQESRMAIAGPSITDGEWHGIELGLVSLKMTLSVDGAQAGDALLSVSNAICQRPKEVLEVGGSVRNSSVGFTGCLDSVRVDNQPINVSAATLVGNASVGCKHSTARFFGLSALRFTPAVWAHDGSVSIRLRTASQNGLIYYTRESGNDANSNVTTDYVALQIINGMVTARVKFSPDWPELSLQSSATVSDNDWHTVSASRNDTVFTLSVDGSSTTAAFPTDLNRLDTGYDVCLGGVDSSTKVIGGVAVSLLDGCLSEYRQNGRFVSLQSNTNSVNVAFGSCSI